MKIPTLVMQQVVDLKTGEHTADYQQYQDNLNQQMQKDLSDDGFVIPVRTTDEIQNIADPSSLNSKPDGTIWYSSTDNKYIGKENGVLVIFSTTPL